MEFKWKYMRKKTNDKIKRYRISDTNIDYHKKLLSVSLYTPTLFPFFRFLSLPLALTLTLIFVFILCFCIFFYLTFTFYLSPPHFPVKFYCIDFLSYKLFLRIRRLIRNSFSNGQSYQLKTYD